MKIEKSIELFKEAQNVIPGGVNSPVRAFKSVGGNPIFIKKALASKIYDVDGNEFIDYICSWGPHLLGHNPDFIQDAIINALNNGVSFGASTEAEINLAKLVKKLVPSVELIRMVNSGTEATMSAIRLARGYTNKNKIIKFEGCYHGHADSFLIKAGSGALTFGIPNSPGVTPNTSQDTLVAQFNNINSVKSLIKENKNQIATVIIEPIAGNMGVISANKDFLHELRDICSQENIILIFDEVMTGFRVAKGGAQELFGIVPDLSTFGKIIGGGLPVGAYGGKKSIMEKISPIGNVYQAGTLSGNPLAMAAGIAMLNYISNSPDLYSILEQKAAYLELAFNDILKEKNKKYCINRVGSMLCLFFTEQKVIDYNSAISSNTGLYSKYFHKMLSGGIFLPPAQFEAMFVSLAHTQQDLNKTLEIFSSSI